MAIFKAPKITTVQRSALILESSEVVYDVDQKAFYGGNGVSSGGFPIGANAGSVIERIPLTQDNIDSKSVTLEAAPLVPSGVLLICEGGIIQIYGLDFVIVGNTITWDNLGLDNFLDNTDVLIVQY